MAGSRLFERLFQKPQDYKNGSDGHLELGRVSEPVRTVEPRSADQQVLLSTRVVDAAREDLLGHGWLVPRRW
jgi:hypothetical protein